MGGTGSVAIAVVGDAGVQVCEVYETAAAFAVFGDPQPDLADPWYDVRLCSTGGGLLRPTHGLADIVTADTVIVPSVPCGQDAPAEFVGALREAAANGARMVAMCSGVFALAEAGILDGRRVTAHWTQTAELAERFPKVTVDDAVLFVDDGDVLTSAGMAAAMDLCLYIVRRDLGPNIANRLARRLVVSAQRGGDQAQPLDVSVPAGPADGLAPVLDWAAGNLEQPLTVDRLARRAGMSPRAFFRRFQEATGTTPMRWLLDQRLTRAQTLLETTDLPIDRVSEHSGLGSAANLRRHFTARVGMSPSGYRNNR